MGAAGQDALLDDQWAGLPGQGAAKLAKKDGDLPGMPDIPVDHAAMRPHGRRRGRGLKHELHGIIDRICHLLYSLYESAPVDVLTSGVRGGCGRVYVKHEWKSWIRGKYQ